MPRPLTRAQVLENHAFLAALRETGNVREAARRIGIAYGTIQHRRSKHPAFAAQFDAAVVMAQARLNAEGGLKAPVAAPRTAPGKLTNGATNGATRAAGAPHRTKGGETVVVRRNDGKFQVRAAQPGKLTRACEQAFLSALSATANVRLSADAAGASVAAFYRRRRQNPGFAREMGLALDKGYERVKSAMLEGFQPSSYADDAWRHNDPPAVPPMTPDQALHLLWLHERSQTPWASHPDIVRRSGEPIEAYVLRLRIVHRAQEVREAQDAAMRAAAQVEGRGEAKWEPPAPVVGDLSRRSKRG